MYKNMCAVFFSRPTALYMLTKILQPKSIHHLSMAKKMRIQFLPLLLVQPLFVLVPVRMLISRIRDCADEENGRCAQQSEEAVAGVE